jgi:putative FmdB family regulatory protein
MPTYEYTCPDCLTRFDMRRRMSQRDMMVECPDCQGMNAARRISLPVVFSHAGKGEVRMMAGAGGSACGSCVASSCAGCR